MSDYLLGPIFISLILLLLVMQKSHKIFLFKIFSLENLTYDSTSFEDHWGEVLPYNK